MQVLVVGAGVIGSLYAARLQQSGHSVTVLARGERLDQIRTQGLILENLSDRTRSTVQVAATAELLPGDFYDLALITVRLDQVAAIVPILAANRAIPTLVLMFNNPLGPADLAETLGKERVLPGFPGAGGSREGAVVQYALIAEQPTTLGELDGADSARLKDLAQAFEAAALPTRIERNMDAWLKAHAFFITAISAALDLEGGDCRRLAANHATLKLMVEGVREGFAAVRALHLPVTPFPLKVLFAWLPSMFAVRYWRKFFASPEADHVFGRHSRSTSNEMREIVKGCRILLDRSGVKAPALARLYAIDKAVEKD